MATRLFLRAASALGGYAAGPADVFSNGAPEVDLSGASPTGPLTLSRTMGSGQTSKAGATLADGVTQDVYFFRLVSDEPLVGPVDANTWTGAFAGSQSNTISNMNMHGCLYVLKDDDTVRGVISALFAIGATILATSEEGRKNTFSGSAVPDVGPTDRLCLEYYHTGAQTMATSYTQTAYWDGTVDPEDNTAISNAAAYIQTPQNLWPDHSGDGREGVFRYPRVRSPRF